MCRLIEMSEPSLFHKLLRLCDDGIRHCGPSLSILIPFPYICGALIASIKCFQGGQEDLYRTCYSLA